jgi:hypothetical protein
MRDVSLINRFQRLQNATSRILDTFCNISNPTMDWTRFQVRAI